MTTESSMVQRSYWTEGKDRQNMVPTWSKHGPDMVPKSVHSMNIGLRPFLLSLQNFRALADLEVKLGQTWSQHGPEN